MQTSPTEWKVTSVGQAKAAAFVLNHAEIRYDAQSRPLAFTLEARVKESPLRINTTVAGGKATSEVIQDDKSTTVTHDVAETSVLLPNNVFGAYEALVARLATLKPGATLRAYIAPQAEISITFDSMTTERVQTTARTFETKHYKLTAQNPGGAMPIEVWADDRDHLMRVTIAQAQIEVVRDDIAVVSTRQQTTFRANDEDVWVLANGFNLAATVSKPAAPAPAPSRQERQREGQAGEAAGDRAGGGLGPRRSRRNRRGHSDLRAAREFAGRRGLSRRALRQARRRSERRAYGGGDARRTTPKISARSSGI